jgi:UDP-glucose 4-epimerase
MVSMADDHYALDTSRAKKLLDWYPQRSILQELPSIIERLKQNPDRWYQENGLKE